MSSAFVPLALFLRPVTRAAAAEEAPPPPAVAAPVCGDIDEALRAARRFRAGLQDAIDAAVEELLPAIARDVLARELQIAAADVAEIVRGALGSDSHDVTSIRAHPDDLDALCAVEFERIPDATLSRGSVRLELRSGTIDLTLDARLDAVLRARVQ